MSDSAESAASPTSVPDAAPTTVASDAAPATEVSESPASAGPAGSTAVVDAPATSTTPTGVPQAEVDALRLAHADEIAKLNAQLESAATKQTALQNENHSLLSRSITSEQQMAELVKERDKLKTQLSKSAAEGFVASGGQGGSATEVSLLELIEHERANAKKHNELRLTVETNFADLSMQYETLQQEYDDLRSKQEATEARANRLQSELKEAKEVNNTLETNVSELAETKERLLSELSSLLKKFEDEKAHHEQTKQACLKAHAVMRQMEEDMEAARLREAATKRELEALKKKAAAWKKQAEAMQEVEARNEQLTIQLQSLQRENLALKQSIRDLQREMDEREEAERVRRSQEISPKMYQFLKDQLDELRKKYDELRQSERSWHKERDELLIRIKRLTNELRNKNPSALRMMEVEVQNELLMTMLQGNAGLSAPSAQPLVGGSASPSVAKKTSLAPVKGGSTATKTGQRAAGASPPPPAASTTPGRRVLPPIETSDDALATSTLSPMGSSSMKAEASPSAARRPSSDAVTAESRADAPPAAAVEPSTEVTA